MKSKILAFIALLFTCTSATGQSSLVIGNEVFYPDQNYYAADNELNLLLVNKIFKTNWTGSVAGKVPGNINGEYLQDYSNQNILDCTGNECIGDCRHKGIDIRTQKLSNPAPYEYIRNIYSIMDGKVVGIPGSYGCIAIYNEAKDITLRYVHCNSLAVGLAINSLVKAGQLIGQSGKTGTVAPHLHIELRKGNGGDSEGACLNHTPESSETYDPRLIFKVFPQKIEILPMSNYEFFYPEQQVKFNWKKDVFAKKYRIQVSSYPNFLLVDVVNKQSNNNFFLLTIPKQFQNKKLYWRVKSDRTPAFDGTEEIRFFHVRPDIPKLITPAFGQRANSGPVNFDWEDVPGVINYRIQISEDRRLRTDPDNPNITYNLSELTGTASNKTWTAAANKIYYWRVSVTTANGTSHYQQGARIFVTANGLINRTESISTLHYWYDSLPEREMPVSNVMNLSLPADSLNPGYHTANFYFKDGTGQRTSITNAPFFKMSGNGFDHKLEYWFDTAFSERNYLTLYDLQNTDTLLNTQDLLPGYHLLSYRFQYEEGAWSSIATSPFLVNNTAESDSSKIIEYWFNNEFENRRSIDIDNESDIDELLETDNLSLGDHTLFYRFKVNGDFWSSVSASTFTKANAQDGPYKYEYWLNNDFDDRQTIDLDSLLPVDTLINTNHLPLGVHTLYSRFQQQGGVWSGVTAVSFLKNTTTGSAAIYQYWVDNNFASSRTINLGSVGNAFSIDSNISVSMADTGWHVLNSRFRQNGATWSAVTVDSFYKNTPPDYPCTINNPPTGDSLVATHFLCGEGIIDNPQDGIVNHDDIRRKDLAKITYKALFGQSEPATLADSLPSLFGDLQLQTASNAYYFRAAKVLSHLCYGDNIPPFNPGRLNFHPEDTIVRGYVLKVLLEAWNIKPDESIGNFGFTDITTGTEVYGYIAKAAQLRIIKSPALDGPNFNNFRPYEATTRIEAFLMLHRLMMYVSKPEVTNNDYCSPFNRNNFVSNNPSLSDGNFSSYGENPFTMHGVPSLSFSFNYNTSLLELPDEVTLGKNNAGDIIYDQRTMGHGFTHSYNAFIINDEGIAAGLTDNRYMIHWPGGSIQTYNPNTHQYMSLGIYDVLTANNDSIPTSITIKTKNQITYLFEKLSGVSGNSILHLVSVKDRHNNTVSLTYENGFSAGANNIKRLKTVNDGHGRYFNFRYIANTNLVDSVDAIAGSLQRTIGFQYIARRVVKYTNPMGDPTIYNYSTVPGSEYLITKIVLPKGNIITNTYTSNRKLSNSKYNTVETKIEATPVYNAPEPFTQTKITTTTDNHTYVQHIRKNKYSMPDSLSGPGINSIIRYATAGINRLLPEKVTNNLTQVEVNSGYDNNGNLVSINKKNISNTINTTESFTYNSFNDVTSHTDANGNTTNYNYNATRQLVQVNAPIGTTSITPNTDGTVQSISNPSGIITNFTYNNYGNLTQTNMPLGISISNEYDAYGRKISTTNPNTVATTYQYDSNDNLKQEIVDPAGLNQITKYRFDKNDNMVEVENAKGNITFLTYNDNDQLIKEQFGNYKKEYTYAADGRAKTFKNPNGYVFTNVYNAQNQLINDGYSTYSYNTDNTLHSISKIGGKTIVYGYDDLKRINSTSYTDFAGNKVQYEYDNNGNIKKLNYKNGTFIVKYDYDANNRLTTVKDSNNVNWATYTYLTDGRLETQTNRNGTISRYFYDLAGRMDSMVTTKANGSIIARYKFVLDKAGNHLSEDILQPLTDTITEPGSFAGYTYNNTNRLLQKNNDTYSYDNNGNITGIAKPTGNISHSYDIRNNLVNYTEGTSTFSYEYDALGQRRRKNNTIFVLDMANNVLAETDLSGNAQYFYIHGLGLIGRIKVSSYQPYYYHYDFRGSTVAITNSSQDITHKYSYGEFGETKQAVEEDYNTYRYVGKYGVGHETNDLTFMRARYYQPTVGRFNSEDPVWSVNLYPYGDNNPITRIDQTGRSWKTTLGLTGVGAAGGILLAAGAVIVGTVSAPIGLVAVGVYFGGAAILGGGAGLAVAAFVSSAQDGVEMSLQKKK